MFATIKDFLTKSAPQSGGVIVPEELAVLPMVQVGLIVDNSTSIRSTNCVEAVCCGHNQFVEKLRQSPAAARILITTVTIHGEYFNRSVPAEEAKLVQPDGFLIQAGTPMSAARSREIRNIRAWDIQQQGKDILSLTIMVSDGDERPRLQGQRFPVAAVCTGVEMAILTGRHCFGAYGIDNGYADFREVFTAMGIPEAWIMTSAREPDDIYAAFARLSDTASRASTSSEAFAQTSHSGFGH